MLYSRYMAIGIKQRKQNIQSVHTNHDMKVASCALLYRLRCTVAWPAAPHVISHGNDRAAIPEFHHSPSNLAESQGQCKVFGLCAGKSLHECVHYHIVGRAEVDGDLAGFYYIVNKVKSDVDVFRASVELFVASECDGGLGVRVQGHRPLRFVYLGDKFSEPYGLLGVVGSGDVFRCGSREGEKRLVLQTPGNGASINQKGVTRDGVPVFV